MAYGHPETIVSIETLIKVQKSRQNLNINDLLSRCEADPAALAKYVLALLRKDKSMADLTQMMSEQLDVFLGVETEPFLERLFAVIKSEEYLKSVGGNSSNLDITKQHQQQQLQPKIPAVTSAHSVQNMKPEELSTSVVNMKECCGSNLLINVFYYF